MKNSAIYNSRIIKTPDKSFAKKLDIKEIKFPVKVRDTQLILKIKNSFSNSAFDNENKEKHSIFVSEKFFEEKPVSLLLIGEKGNRHSVLIKDFIIFIHNHTLNRKKQHFWRYFLQAFSTEKILKRHIKDCFEINSKQRITIPKKIR